MKPGWLRRLQTTYRAKRISDELISQIGNTLKDNPQLSIEEALGVIDKNKTIFFPGEESRPADLKTLFASIVWKTYRCNYPTSTHSAPDEYRDVVFRAAYSYLSRPKADEGRNVLDIDCSKKALSRLIWRRSALVAAATMIIAVLGGILFFEPNVLFMEQVHVPGFIQTRNTKYNGYIADARETRALIDKNIYRKGDQLDQEGKYVLKSIYPQYIVIEEKKDKKDFIVHLHNK